MTHTPKISLIHPSYGRPHMARMCFKEWMTKSSVPEEQIEYILCLSQKDRTLDAYLSIFSREPRVTIIIVPFNGMIAQLNRAASLSTGDIMIGLFDDFGCEQFWDKELLKFHESMRCGRDFYYSYVLKTEDGIQPDILTLPIMNRGAYERLGYMYNPIYYHMYADEELEKVAKNQHLYHRADIMFPHRHYTKGFHKKDATNVQNEKYYQQDAEIYYKRKKDNFGGYLLSILILTTPDRKEHVDKLIHCLEKQRIMLHESVKYRVQILVNSDEDVPIGVKRNDLLLNAPGKYVCFIDDDDRISDNYLALLFDGIFQDVDCCNLKGIYYKDGVEEANFEHSLKYDHYFEEMVDGKRLLCRPPNHLNMIRAEIAKKFPFPCTSYGEDTDWAMEICKSGLIQTEHEIQSILYYYDYVSNKKSPA